MVNKINRHSGVWSFLGFILLIIAIPVFLIQLHSQQVSQSEAARLQCIPYPPCYSATGAYRCMMPTRPNKYFRWCLPPTPFPLPTGCVMQTICASNSNVGCRQIPVCMTPNPSSKPTPSCMPRPACLDAKPACLIAEPVNGWCPTGTPSLTPSVMPTLIPCQTNNDCPANYTCAAPGPIMVNPTTGKTTNVAHCYPNGQPLPM